MSEPFQHEPALPGPDAERRAGRLRALLGSMRIRKKMILLHTGFSLTLAVVLLLSLRPAIREVVQAAERQTCLTALEMLSRDPGLATRASVENVEFGAGSAEDLGLSAREARLAREGAGAPVFIHGDVTPQRVARYDRDTDTFLVVSANAVEARASVIQLYLFLTAALLGVYFLIALSLELVVLPRQVYEPIRALLRADLAVQEGRRAEELIAPGEMPSDELGEIMRSRNESIIRLRRQEAALNDALERIERIAVELKRKNHLLETARRNLADQDRLASLGMMSAGIAHELNTPLAVLKGQVERLADDPERGVAPPQAQLMLRVVRRLERLSESLLDFARVRPPAREAVGVRALVDEAWTLVRLDREAGRVSLLNPVPATIIVTGAPDRLGQVFVNLRATPPTRWTARERSRSSPSRPRARGDAGPRSGSAIRGPASPPRCSRASSSPSSPRGWIPREPVSGSRCPRGSSASTGGSSSRATSPTPPDAPAPSSRSCSPTIRPRPRPRPRARHGTRLKATRTQAKMPPEWTTEPRPSEARQRRQERRPREGLARCRRCPSSRSTTTPTSVSSSPPPRGRAEVRRLDADECGHRARMPDALLLDIKMGRYSGEASC